MNDLNVGVARGIAYRDSGFIKPALLAAVAQRAKDGQAAPKGLDVRLVTREALSVDNLVRLHQRIRSVLRGLRTVYEQKLQV